MALARVINGEYVGKTGVPKKARRQDNNLWVCALGDGAVNEVSLRIACGYYPLVEDERPPDTPTHTYDEIATVYDNYVHITWEQREWTQEELDDMLEVTHHIEAKTLLSTVALRRLEKIIERTTNAAPATQDNVFDHVDLLVKGMRRLAKIQKAVVLAQWLQKSEE